MIDTAFQITLTCSQVVLFFHLMCMSRDY